MKILQMSEDQSEILMKMYEEMKESNRTGIGKEQMMRDLTFWTPARVCEVWWWEGKEIEESCVCGERESIHILNN